MSPFYEKLYVACMVLAVMVLLALVALGNHRGVYTRGTLEIRHGLKPVVVDGGAP